MSKFISTPNVLAVLLLRIVWLLLFLTLFVSFGFFRF